MAATPLQHAKAALVAGLSGSSSHNHLASGVHAAVPSGCGGMNAATATAGSNFRPEHSGGADHNGSSIFDKDHNLT